MNEGTIKFNYEWNKKPLPAALNIGKLIYYRNKLYSLGLIGADKHGIGFGNISVLYKTSGKFIISGSDTGRIKSARKYHFSIVHSVDLKNNFVACTGMKAASSESLTHSTIYNLSPEIKCAVHVHNLKLWKTLLNKVPTTAATVSYGTPEMADEVKRLWLNSDLKEKKIIVMSGHKAGIIVFAENITSAYKLLMNYLI